MHDELAEWLRNASDNGASDLHFSPGVPPMRRINARLERLASRPLTADECLAVVRGITTKDHWQQVQEQGDTDFSYTIDNVHRYRVHVYMQRGCVSAAIRVIPRQMPTVSGLGLPQPVVQFTERRDGLLLVTGPAGSGKSSTLAALVDYVNHRQAKHIVTLEDPIEFLHAHDRSVIHQREIGNDTPTFERGLRSALRQDPDIILIGEMRDLETVKTALTAAETGHLVLATLHTADAVQSIDRIINLFPPDQHRQTRSQLAAVLAGVVSQRLVPTYDQRRRTLACEVLVNTSAVANLIRTDKVHQLHSAMQTGRQYGMQTLTMHLDELLASGKVSPVDVHSLVPESQAARG